MENKEFEIPEGMQPPQLLEIKKGYGCLSCGEKFKDRESSSRPFPRPPHAVAFYDAIHHKCRPLPVLNKDFQAYIRRSLGREDQGWRCMNCGKRFSDRGSVDRNTFALWQALNHGCKKWRRA